MGPRVRSQLCSRWDWCRRPPKLLTSAVRGTAAGLQAVPRDWSHAGPDPRPGTRTRPYWAGRTRLRRGGGRLGPHLGGEAELVARHAGAASRGYDVRWSDTPNTEKCCCPRGGGRSHRVCHPNAQTSTHAARGGGGMQEELRGVGGGEGVPFEGQAIRAVCHRAGEGGGAAGA